MSKAVLVMDMPSSCDKCSLVRMVGNNFICIPKENSKDFCSVYYQVRNELRPDWCPLREFPEKITSWKGKSTNYQQGHRDGHNACIDELLKGEEG